MKLIAIPNFGERISPRIDFSETMQLISIDGKDIIKQETIKVIAHSIIERINYIIRLKPDIIICDGISILVHNRFIENKIQVIPWVHGRVEDIIRQYLNDELDSGNNPSRIN